MTKDQNLPPCKCELCITDHPWWDFLGAVGTLSPWEPHGSWWLSQNPAELVLRYRSTSPQLDPVCLPGQLHNSLSLANLHPLPLFASSIKPQSSCWLLHTSVFPSTTICLYHYSSPWLAFLDRWICPVFWAPLRQGFHPKTPVTGLLAS